MSFGSYHSKHPSSKQHLIVQENSVSHSPTLDLNKSLKDFVFIQSASLSPFVDNKENFACKVNQDFPNVNQDYPKVQETKQFNPNPNPPFIQSKRGPHVRATARKTIRPQTPLPNPLRKAIKLGVVQALNQAHNQGPLGVQFMVVLSL